jgi:Coenzyme PQQ synthesis protein D (PqqD)
MSLSRLERTPDLIERQVADETFLLPVRGALANTVEMFALSEVGHFIWSRADGTRNLEDLVGCVLQEFEVAEDQARAEVTEFVLKLQAYGLMTEVKG